MQTLIARQTAEWLFERNRYKEAAEAVIEHLSQHPEDPAAHALLALCQCALKNNVLAKHHAGKAIALEPGNANHHFVLSRVLVRLFDWELVPVRIAGETRQTTKAAVSPASLGSLQSIEKAIELQPENPDFYAHLALLKLMFTRWDEALEATARGLELFPQHIGCLVYRASAWLETDQPQKADETLRNMLALDPNSPYGHVGMGDLALYRREAGEAEQHYREALRLNPMLAWAEHGLKATRALEMGRAFSRELLTTTDPLFKDPAESLRKAGIAVMILGIVVALVVLISFFIVAKFVTR